MTVDLIHISENLIKSRRLNAAEEILFQIVETDRTDHHAFSCSAEFLRKSQSAGGVAYVWRGDDVAAR